MLNVLHLNGRDIKPYQATVQKINSMNSLFVGNEIHGITKSDLKKLDLKHISSGTKITILMHGRISQSTNSHEINFTGEKENYSSVDFINKFALDLPQQFYFFSCYAGSVIKYLTYRNPETVYIIGGHENVKTSLFTNDLLINNIVGSSDQNPYLVFLYNIQYFAVSNSIFATNTSIFRIMTPYEVLLSHDNAKNYLNSLVKDFILFANNKTWLNKKNNLQSFEFTDQQVQTFIEWFFYNNNSINPEGYVNFLAEKYNDNSFLNNLDGPTFCTKKLKTVSERGFQDLSDIFNQKYTQKQISSKDTQGVLEKKNSKTNGSDDQEIKQANDNIQNLNPTIPYNNTIKTHNEEKDNSLKPNYVEHLNNTVTKSALKEVVDEKKPQKIIGTHIQNDRCKILANEESKKETLKKKTLDMFIKIHDVITDLKHGLTDKYFAYISFGYDRYKQLMELIIRNNFQSEYKQVLLNDGNNCEIDQDNNFILNLAVDSKNSDFLNLILEKNRCKFDLEALRSRCKITQNFDCLNIIMEYQSSLSGENNIEHSSYSA